ncbi:MAG: hypothetical protein FH748_08540 [Balneolaceae bacterium]|nr:hypothetical protein [Balneolaceae bacterium]
MKENYSPTAKSFALTVLITLLSIAPVAAQFTSVGAFLRAGKEDATLLTKEYLKPFPTGFGTGLNAGWTETAAPKKTLGLSLQIRSSLAFVPSSAREFDISALTLQKINVAQGGNPVTQTIAGSNDDGPLLKIYDDPDDPNRNELGQFNMPGGTGLPVVPAPIVQAGLGLMKGTDITARFVPETDIGNYGSIGLLGGAIKHDITQWLPGDKLLPVDISLMVGFTQMNMDGDLSLPPSPSATRDPNDPSLVSNPNPDFSSQLVTATTNTFVFNALVGKSLPLISVYGGIGFQKATFELDIEGDYPVPSFNPTTVTQDYIVLQDPISFEIDSESNAHLLGGFRLKLGFLAIYGEATLAEYFTANAGIGISIR